MVGTYNEVQATQLGRKKKNKRKSTTTGDSSAPPPSNATSPDQASWPQSLQDFVNRSFARSEALSPNDKAVFNQQIQTIIYSAARDKKIWTNDWEAQCLPIFNPEVPLALHQDLPRNNNIAPSGSYDSNERKRQRAARFNNQSSASPKGTSPSPSNRQIIGTSTALEKRYLRLTSEPDPGVVRPEAVLRKCLAFVVEKYRTSNNSYSYINDQLKAIRQDLTVQHIKNDLAIEVYETHGRIAIENRDLGEFNQCQSQLKHLYALKTDRAFYKHTYEFTCYRILYLLLTGNYSDICLTRLDLLHADSATNEESLERIFQLRRQGVYNALRLLDYVVLGSYHHFFKIYTWYKTHEGMDCAFLLLEHFMAAKQRLITLNAICKAYKKLPVDYLSQELALEPGATFFKDHELSIFVSDTDFDCMAARPKLQALVDQGNFKKVDIKGQV